MSNRQVYLDFQDGNGFINISSLVKYDTLTYTQRAFNDNYHLAQNTCNVDVLYDPIIFPKLRYVTKDILIRIVDVKENVLITTEDDWFITTEDSFYLCTEYDIAVPVFYGHIPPSKSRVYDGIIENTIFTLEATDELDWMDVPVGDVAYSGYQVLNPANPTHSIVHALASIAGWDTSRVTSSTYIDALLPQFAPNDVEDTVKTVLDTLLFEYGYSLNLDASGIVEPVRWNIPASQPSTRTFDDTNILHELKVEDGHKSYDGIKVVYYDMGTASKVRLFTDDNCGFNDDGSFTGYSIPASYYYPPEANTIDETTGVLQIVYQEYTDDAIKYWTNKAIKENLGYNYKAFSSDFSSLVYTYNHFVDRRVDTGISIITSTFGNRKARILYKNTGSVSAKIYYNDIYGDVWYKSKERSSTIDLVKRSTDPVDPTKVYKYTASYIFDKVYADAFTKTLAAQFDIGKTTYTFDSEVDHAGGLYVTIHTGDGTNQGAIIREKSYNEKTEQYKYTCIACSLDRPELTGQTVSLSVSIDTATHTNKLTVGQINVPYSGTTPDYTNAYTDMVILKDGVDVSQDWTFSAAPVGVSGAFDGTIKNRYRISGITTTTGTVYLTATKTGWTNQQATLTVIKAVGAKGDPGTGITLKGSVINYTYLPSSGQVTGDTYIVESAGGGYDAGDGATWNGSTWSNVGPIQGPAGTPSYIHIAYANDANGTDFSMSDPTNRTYMGTYADSNPSDSGDYHIYTWKKYVGADGTNGTNGTNAIVMTSASSPAGTYTGQMGIYSSRIYQWNGSSWILQAIQPRYLGISPAGSDPASPNIGDYFLRFSTTSGAAYRGIFQWGGSSWSRTTDSFYIGTAISDILYLIGNSAYGTMDDYGGTYFRNLFAQYIRVLSSGSIAGGTRYDQNGNVSDVTQPGFYLGANGILKADSGEFTGKIVSDEATFYKDMEFPGETVWQESMTPITIDLVNDSAASIAATIDSLLVNSDSMYMNSGNSFVVSGGKTRFCAICSSDISNKYVINNGGYTLQVVQYVARYMINPGNLGTLTTRYVVGADMSSEYGGGMGSYERLIVTDFYGTKTKYTSATASNKLLISAKTTAVELYGSTLNVNGQFNARKGIHLRRRGLYGDINYALTSRAQVFDLVNLITNGQIDQAVTGWWDTPGSYTVPCFIKLENPTQAKIILASTQWNQLFTQDDYSGITSSYLYI